jgi:hypothetical protein
MRGGGHRASPKFTLRAANAQHDRLELHGGYTAVMILGGIVTGAGAAVVLVALDNILLGPVAGPAYTGSIYGPSSTVQEEVQGGLILLAIGLPVALGGYWLVRASRTPTVSQEVVSAPPLPQAWVRSPDARETAWTRQLLPTFVALPILRGVF